jgi:hypothetical protein
MVFNIKCVKNGNEIRCASGLTPCCCCVLAESAATATVRTMATTMMDVVQRMENGNYATVVHFLI